MELGSERQINSITLRERFAASTAHDLPEQ
jgi:hypothetical protein